MTASIWNPGAPLAESIDELFTVDTIADLKAVDKTERHRILVAGYYAVRDGGGGVYYYDSSDTTSVDNLGTIIVGNDGARWKLDPTQVVTARQFGAVADGVTDSLVNFQAAINYVVSIGGELRVSAGNYFVSDAIVIDYSATILDPVQVGGLTRLKIVGDGAGSTQLKSTHAGACIDYRGGPINTNGMHALFSIRDISLFNGTRNAGSIAIKLDNCAFFDLDHFSILGFDYGIDATDALLGEIANGRIWSNNQGYRFRYANVSRPNALTMRQCAVASNRYYGGLVEGCAAFNIIGGSIEGNGIYPVLNTIVIPDGDVAKQNYWGVKSVNAGVEGSTGLVMSGVYCEGNQGYADVWIAQATNNTSHSLTGCSFLRYLAGTYNQYTLYNVLFEPTVGAPNTTLALTGCGFKSQAPYVAANTRPYVGAAPGKVTDCGGNLFDNYTEFDAAVKTPLELARIPTAYLPTPSFRNIGNLAYDTTTSTVKLSDGTFWKELLFSDSQVIRSVTEFGAIADHTPGVPASGTNNTAAFQAAFAAARNVYIPAGNYKVDALLITRRIKLWGAGADSSRVFSTVSGANNALVVLPPAGMSGAENRFYHFNDFSLEPTVSGAGHDGLYFELASGAFLSNSTIERILVGNFGRYGIHLNNAPFSNLDGFFTITIRRNWITNGLYLQKFGDSATIAENTITGNNVGVFITGLSGARQVVIRDNNVTTAGGAIFASATEQLGVYNNQFEMLAITYTGAYNSWVCIADSYLPTLRDNTITARTPSVVTPPVSAILLDGTTAEALIDNNYIHIGTTYHISIAPTVTSTRVARTNRYAVAYTGADPVFDNLGIDTVGIRRDCSGYTNGWVQYDSVNNPVGVTKNTEGWVALTGSVSTGTSAPATATRMFTLPSGCRPPSLKFFTVAARTGTTWSTVTLSLDISGNVWNDGVIPNAEVHLDGIAFVVKNT